MTTLKQFTMEQLQLAIETKRFAFTHQDAATQLLASMQREADLKHDIERHLQISSELAREIEQLRMAAVLAVAPLEALRISGASKLLSPETQAAIDEGIAAVRNALVDQNEPPGNP